MIVSMAYKYKLVVSKKQKQLLLNHIFIHNQTWNVLLNQFFQESESNKLRKEQNLDPIYLSDIDKDSMIKKILKNRNLSFNTKIIQQCSRVFKRNLIYTLSEMKKGNKDIGMLTFKDSRNFNNHGFKTTKEQFSILDSSNPKFKVLRLFRENLKIRWTRDFPINSEIKTLNLSFKDNSFYVSFNIVYDSNNMIDHNKIDYSYLKPLGMDINIDSIDLGNKLLHKVFNIKDIKLNNLISKNEKKIKRLKRKQSRRVEIFKNEKKKNKDETKIIKLGKNFYKTQRKINKISTKNSNIKVFKLHQIVNEILSFMKSNGYNHIIMENLDVKQMTSKDNINKTIGKRKSKTMKKNILQISFAMFKTIMMYKCAMSGIYISLVEPQYTSKECSCCGNIDKKLNITKRTYECKECGLKIKRDHNSCINMLNKFYK